METVFAGAQLRALLFTQEADDTPLIVTFDFRQTGRSGFSADTHSTQFHRRGFAQLSIKSAANDWFINGETRALEAALAPIRERYSRRWALGYSMGGFGAFRFSASLGLQRVTAVSPQSTLDPALAPWEWRYKAEAAGFDPLLGALPERPRLEALIVADPFVRVDRLHAERLLALYPRARLARLGFGGHPAMTLLRDAGQGWVIQREAMANRQVPGRVSGAHRALRRGSADYWTRLAEAAATRRPALAEAALARAEALTPPT